MDIRALCIIGVTGTILTGAAAADLNKIAEYQLNVGTLVSVAVDPAGGRVFVYDDFATTIRVLDRAGVEQSTIPFSGQPSNDIDLDFLDTALTIGGANVAAGALLNFNAEVGVTSLLAMDSNSGAVLATLANMGGSGSAVGGAQHSARGSVYTVRWNTDLIYEQNADTGALLNSFSVSPGGSPAFDVFFGDIEVSAATGNLYIVSSSHNLLRVLGPTGAYLGDVDLTALGVTSMSGLAIDDLRGEAWITGTNGVLYHIGGLPSIPSPSAASLLALTALVSQRRRR